MIPAPIPADEAARLKALRQLLVLDTPPEARYDRIVRFAASLFDVPMALISLSISTPSQSNMISCASVMAGW